MWLTLDDLATEAPTADEAWRECNARIRGFAMHAWAANIDARHGVGAAAALRKRLGLSHAELADAPDGKAWIPAQIQLQLTEALVAQHYGGDLRHLEPDLIDDSTANIGALTRGILRRLGPARMLSHAPSVHPRLWDCGTAEITMSAKEATIHVSGEPTFTTRMYLALNLFALGGIVRIGGGTLQSRAAQRLGRDASALRVTWA